jgi:AraC-like DNA-binding protein
LCTFRFILPPASREQKPMVEIALDVGYTNPSHFAQLFRKEPDSLPAIIVSNADKSPATLLSNL